MGHALVRFLTTLALPVVLEFQSEKGGVGRRFAVLLSITAAE